MFFLFDDSIIALTHRPIKADNTVYYWLNGRRSLQSPVNIMRIPLLFISLIPRPIFKRVCVWESESDRERASEGSTETSVIYFMYVLQLAACVYLCCKRVGSPIYIWLCTWLQRDETVYKSEHFVMQAIKWHVSHQKPINNCVLLQLLLIRN